MNSKVKKFQGTINGRVLQLIVLLFFCWLGSASAQMDRLRLGLTLQPLPLFEFYQGGNLRLGLQTRIAPRLFLHGEYGQYLNALHYNTRQLQGYNWRIALQYNYSAFYYVSLDYFYKDHAFQLTDEIDLQGMLSEKSYRLQKYSNAITLKWGKMVWTKKNRLYTDLYMGAGLRLRNVSQSGLTQEEFQNITSSSIIYQSARKTGQIISPEFSFGFRLGLALFKQE